MESTSAQGVDAAALPQLQGSQHEHAAAACGLHITLCTCCIKRGYESVQSLGLLVFRKWATLTSRDLRRQDMSACFIKSAPGALSDEMKTTQTQMSEKRGVVE